MVLSSECKFYFREPRMIADASNWHDFSGLLQALFVPHAWNSRQSVNFIAAGKEIYFFYRGGTPGEFELLRFELIVVLAGLEKFFEEGAVRDANFAADLKFRFIDSFGLSHR